MSTSLPTTNPTTTSTTAKPTLRPTTITPTERPTPTLTDRPTPTPTIRQTDSPTTNPTITPTERPTPTPTDRPTDSPTTRPTTSPTLNPTPTPTDNPTINPTLNPTANPTENPTAQPTHIPTVDPTVNPTAVVTADPTTNPTINPTASPTVVPTSDPTTNPTTTPTLFPTAAPTLPYVLDKKSGCLTLESDGHLSTISQSSDSINKNILSQCLRFESKSAPHESTLIRIEATFSTQLPNTDYQQLLITSSELDTNIILDDVDFKPKTCSDICQTLIIKDQETDCFCVDGYQRQSNLAENKLYFLVSSSLFDVANSHSTLKKNSFRSKLISDMKKNNRISILKQLKKNILSVKNDFNLNKYFTIFTDQETTNIEQLTFSIYSGLVNNSIKTPVEHEKYATLLFPGFETNILLSNLQMPSAVTTKQIKEKKRKEKEGDLKIITI